MWYSLKVYIQLSGIWAGVGAPLEQPIPLMIYAGKSPAREDEENMTKKQPFDSSLKLLRTVTPVDIKLELDDDRSEIKKALDQISGVKENGDLLQKN